jgi:membrane protein DedA with SNARE-associated domain
LHLSIHYLLHHYGYFGIFFILCIEMLGLPFPAETTLTASGIAWTKGYFSLIPLLLVCTLANVLGSTLAYIIGRYFGRAVILKFGRRFGVTEARLAKAEDTMEKYRILVIFMAKFIAGVRVFVPYLAGINKMPFMRFTVLNSLAALIWVTLFVIMGKYIEVAWMHYHLILQPFMWPIIITIVILAVLYIVLKKTRMRNKI